MLAEFAVLLPVYILLIYGTFYLGYSAIIAERTREASGYVAQKPGIQSSSNASSLHLERYPGGISRYDEDQSFPDEFSPRGIYESIVEASVIPYGRYVMRDGQLYYEVILDERWAYEHLLDYDIIVSELLSGYAMDSANELEFTYTPAFLGLRDVGLPPVDIASSHEAYVPLGRSRPITGDPHPVVERIARWRGENPDMPGFEPTEPFWAPQ